MAISPNRFAPYQRNCPLLLPTNHFQPPSPKQQPRCQTPTFVWLNLAESEMQRNSATFLPRAHTRARSLALALDQAKAKASARLGARTLAIFVSPHPDIPRCRPKLQTIKTSDVTQELNSHAPPPPACGLNFPLARGPPPLVRRCPAWGVPEGATSALRKARRLSPITNPPPLCVWRVWYASFPRLRPVPAGPPSPCRSTWHAVSSPRLRPVPAGPPSPCHCMPEMVWFPIDGP